MSIFAMKSMSYDSRSGFSLVELLVVVAILAVLASLLLTGLSAATDRSRSSACQAQLRQLQLAWGMYADENGGTMVPNEEGRQFGFWEGVRDAWVLGNARRDSDPKTVQGGSLYEHVPNAAVYVCPSERTPTENDPARARARSYSLNGELNYWIIADQQYGLPVLRAFHKLSDLDRPSRTYAFLDVTPDTIDSGVFGMPGPAATTKEELKENFRELSKHRWLHLPGIHHGDGANVTFLDGHVEHRPWRFPERKPVSPFGHRPASDADFADMRWLIQRTAAWQRYF